MLNHETQNLHPSAFNAVRHGLAGTRQVPKEALADVALIEADLLATGEPCVVIRAHDVSHRMHRGRRTEAYKNMTDGDIVRKLAKRSGVAAVRTEIVSSRTCE